MQIATENDVTSWVKLPYKQSIIIMYSLSRYIDDFHQALYAGAVRSRVGVNHASPYTQALYTD